MATADVLYPSSTPSAPKVLPFTETPPAPKKHNVETTLHYYKDPGDGSEPAPAIVGKPETYFRPSEDQKVTVTDISGDEDKYTLDSHGFQIYKFPSVEKAFTDEEQIKAQYYPEVEKLLKEATGASRVFIFDHTIRRNHADNRTGSAQGPAQVQLRGPVRRVHIDQSYGASTNRVYHHLPEEADELVRKRYQIINVWRPIRQIFKDPLACSSAQSVPDTDLVATALVYPDRRGETYSVRPNPRHKWYFKYAQRPEEVTLIKCFDSRTDVARRVPHTAFENPAHVGENDYSRESIEVRTLVFYDSE